MFFSTFFYKILLVLCLVRGSFGELSNASQVLGDRNGELGTGDELVSIWHLFDQYQWLKRTEKLENVVCKKHMEIYVKNLRQEKYWALKMFDASGRYNSPFFFGNNFWLGSLTLCDELSNKESNAEQPPFLIHFYVAKIRISNFTNLPTEDRQILLGQCLPRSCKVSDVQFLLSQESYHGGTLDVLDLRAIPGDYSVFTDQKAHIVGGCTLIIVLLVLLASIVEVIQKRNSKDLEVSRNKEGNANEGNNRKKESNVYLRLLLAFSALNNGKKVLSVEKLPTDSINCLHGLRFFSIAWIVMVHTYLAAFGVGRNKTLRNLTEKNFMYQTISNATFSVDTFFFISGLLVTLMFLRSDGKKEKSSKSIHFLKAAFLDIFKFSSMIIYRFLRLTPAYFYVLVLNEIVMKNIHSNSVFSPAIYDHVTCKKFWWRNILYINNFFPQKEFCMLWSWYLANDSQFHVIASIFLVIAVRNTRALKFVSISMILLLISSWIVTFIIAMRHQYVARVEQPFALFDELYDKPWMRIGPYLIGMSTGYILYKNDCKIKIHYLLMVLGWLLAISCLGSLVYGLGRKGLVVPASAFYVALGHTAWGVSIAWITIACSSGYGGPLNNFLSWRLFLPLSRLTFCAYLVHPMMMCLTGFALDGPIQLHNFYTLVIFFGNLVLSFLTAFAISMAFEAPMVNILKIIFS